MLRRIPIGIPTALLLTLLAVGIARPGAATAQTAGGFAGTPAFSTGGQAAAVFLGGSVDQLETAARNVGANGVWVQHSSGAFELLIVGGPQFLRDAFVKRFGSGFVGSIAVTLTRPPGATAPPPGPSSTATATPRLSGPTTFPGGIPGPAGPD